MKNKIKFLALVLVLCVTSLSAREFDIDQDCSSFEKDFINYLTNSLIFLRQQLYIHDENDNYELSRYYEGASFQVMCIRGRYISLLEKKMDSRG